MSSLSNKRKRKRTTQQTTTTPDPPPLLAGLAQPRLRLSVERQPGPFNEQFAVFSELFTFRVVYDPLADAEAQRITALPAAHQALEQRQNLIRLLADTLLEIQLFVDQQTGRQDFVQLRLESDSLPHGPIVTSIERTGAFDAQAIYLQAAAALNSNEEVNVEDPTLRFVLERIPMGGGAGKNKSFFDKVSAQTLGQTFSEIKAKNRTLISTPDDLLPGYCLVGALLLGLRQWKGELKGKLFDTKAKRQSFERDIRQFTQVRYKDRHRVLKNSDGRTPKNPITPAELAQLVKYNTPHVVPKEVGILILQQDRADTIVQQIRPQASHIIHLLQVGHHYAFIKNIGTYKHKPGGFFCSGCHQIIRSVKKHRCDSRTMCVACKSFCEAGVVRVHDRWLSSVEPRVFCSDCGRFFFNQSCFQNHLQSGLSPHPSLAKGGTICQQIRACPHCPFKELAARRGQLLKSSNGFFIRATRQGKGKAAEHHCFTVVCWRCQKSFNPHETPRHQCYVRVLDEATLKQRNDKEGSYVYYDIETMLVPEHQPNPQRPGHVITTQKFVPNLFCFQFVTPASKKVHEFVIQGSDCIRCHDFTGVQTITTYLENYCGDAECVGRRCLKCLDFNQDHGGPRCEQRETCDYRCATCQQNCHCRQLDEFEMIMEDCVTEGCCPKALEQTMNFLFFAEDSVLATKKPHRFVAHNAASFDALVILAEYLRRSKEAPTTIQDGCRIKFMQMGQCFFLDSRLFIPGSLEKMAQDFKLPLTKGFFPHRFNTYDHQNYAGPLPGLEWFKNEWETVERLPKVLLEWHREESQRLRDTCTDWVFMQELQNYCQRDVSVLRQAFEKFRHEVFAETGIMPGNGNITTAGCANDIWRSKHLSPDTVGVVPERGLGDPRQSAAAIQYLNYRDAFYYGGLLQFPAKNGQPETKVVVELTLDTPVLPGPSSNPQEEYVPRTTRTFKLDGYYEDHFESGVERVAVEFYGCLYHGCPKCFPGDLPHPIILGKTMHQLYQDTLEREHLLQQAGLELDIMYECQWRDLVRNNPEVQERLREMDWLTPTLPTLDEEEEDEATRSILPRQALYGGRTMTMAMHVSLRDFPIGTVIKYYDIISLYPFVMSTCQYPIGHPEIYTENLTKDVDAYFGLMRGQFLPPRDLLHPVLPMRVQDKLCFPLCAACARESQFTIQGCTHDDPQQRALKGTFTTVEVYAAMHLGYTILRLDRVWHWSEKSSHLFKSYIDTFFRLKQEASGWPQGVETPEQKQEYLDQIFEETGLMLRPERVEVNPTRRLVAKLLLNSLWGGFVKNPGKRLQRSFFFEPKDFWQWLNDETLKEKNFKVLSQKVLLATYRQKELYQEHDGKGNMVHGIFTTAYARLHLLHSALLVKGRSVLYMDTDSVIVLEEAAQTSPPLDIDDTRLGKWKDELPPKPHPETGVMTPRYICDFVSGGPKNYAYVVVWANADGSIPPYHERRVESTKCVVRGFRRDNDAVTFEVMRQCVLDCGTWAKASLEERQVLMAEGWMVSPSGVVCRTHQKIQSQRFTIVKGSRKPLAAVRPSGRISSHFQETLEAHFGLAPSLMTRAYSLVNDKVITDFQGQLGLAYFCYPFGYLVPKTEKKSSWRKKTR